MSDTEWFEVVEEASLLRGDILSKCPVFVPDGELTWPLSLESSLGFRADLIELIVLTQSCDLANDKVPDVLLARVVPWVDVVRDEVRIGNEFAKSARFRKQLIDGSISLKRSRATSCASVCRTMRERLKKREM